MLCKHSVVLVPVAFFVAAVLHGCGNVPGPTPAPSTTPKPTTTPGSTPAPTNTTTTPTPPPKPHEFNLNPIEVRGQHLYDSVTQKPFFATGIAFPNKLPDDDIKVWIEILQRIKKQGKNINMIRLYEVPSCIWKDMHGWCFRDFMKEADRLGIYVLVPGSGAVSGYIPRSGWTTAQECYEQGEVLNMGRGIVQRLSYPNTLAIMIGNEFFAEPTTFRAASVFKAYARDLKKYMSTCNEDKTSPSYGKMRQIPLMYAARDIGDIQNGDLMKYLKCGSTDVSIDIFGLNVERWCDPDRTTDYDSIAKVVKDANLPGTFMFSEMGCPQSLVARAPAGQSCHAQPNFPKCCPRNWNQVPKFFEMFQMFDGFSAYAYWNDGAVNFNMFDGKLGNAKVFQDGLNFFAQTDRINTAAVERPITHGKTPVCASKLHTVEVLPYEAIKSYHDDKFPPSQCPFPTQAMTAIV